MPSATAYRPSAGSAHRLSSLFLRRPQCVSAAYSKSMSSPARRGRKMTVRRIAIALLLLGGMARADSAYPWLEHAPRAPLAEVIARPPDAKRVALAEGS